MGGFNKKHAKAVQVTDPEIVRRICANTAYNPESGCWHWMGYKDLKGYGQVHWRGQARWVHRLTYAAFIGPIADRLQIDHTCRNPSCCNPAHLEAVTALENRKRQTQRAKDDHDHDHDELPI